MARPPFEFHGFVGQRRVLAPVLQEQKGALAHGEPMPHVLLLGPSGIGKTALSEALAKHAKADFRKIIGRATSEEIIESLRNLRPGDYHVYDEAHNLGVDQQEMLYEVIDKGHVPVRCLPLTQRASPVAIAPATLIFATDQPGRLSNALLKRLPQRIRLHNYTENEMKEIVSRIAQGLNVLLSPQASRAIARICSGLPRRAKHHVQSVRLFFADSERSQLGQAEVEEYRRKKAIESDGLTEIEIDYLRHLLEETRASLDTLAAVLGVDAPYVVGEVEQALRYRGLIRIGSGGRALTSVGRRRAEAIGPIKDIDEDDVTANTGPQELPLQLDVLEIPSITKEAEVAHE